MFACHLGREIVLLTTTQLGELISQLLSDVPGLDLFSFKTALHQHVAIGNARNQYRKWESLFCSRLAKAVSAGDVHVPHDFVGDLAREFVEDFLEVNRAAHRRINYARGLLHNGSDAILHIRICRPQNFLQRALNRYGEQENELNILLSSVRRITGTAQAFTMRADSITYKFDELGVSREMVA